MEDAITRDDLAQTRTRKSLRRPISLWLKIPMGLYLAVLALLSGINLLGPERWWWSSFNLYLPQWIWALPGIPLLALFLWKARRFAWLPLLGLLWVLGPLMGFCWRWFSPAADPAKGTLLRVMTYNVKRGRYSIDAIAQEIVSSRADLLIFQECNSVRRGAVADLLQGWNVRAFDQYMIATRLPLSVAEPRGLNFGHVLHQCMRCEVQVGKQTVVLYNVHFLSPRRGLNALRSEKEEGVDDFTWNATIRMEQSKRMAQYLHAETHPVIATGDLNAPVQALVCRQLFDAGMRDAFSEAGRGYGYSYGQKIKHLKHPYLRIDHILVSKEWQVQDCWAGNTEGSEHRPVTAELYLPDNP